MTKSELKDIIHECVDEIIEEYKSDIEASYNARRVSDINSGGHDLVNRSVSKLLYDKSKTGFSNSNLLNDAGKKRDQKYKDELKDGIKYRERARKALKEHD